MGYLAVVLLVVLIHLFVKIAFLLLCTVHPADVLGVSERLIIDDILLAIVLILNYREIEWHCILDNW